MLESSMTKYCMTFFFFFYVKTIILIIIKLEYGIKYVADFLMCLGFSSIQDMLRTQ